MESNLNHEFIESYSKSFAEKVASVFYSENPVITGKEILNLCPIKQVNLFVVKTLLVKWKEETKNLKSPYFDYEEKVVKKALKEFLNLLSQHISIEKQDFLPLLERAVYETILIILSPYDYYCKEINSQNKTRVSLKGLKEVAKYIKVNRHVIDALILRFERDSTKEVFNDEAFRVLNEVFGEMNEAPEDIENYVQLFSQVLPLDINAVYGTADGEEGEEEFEGFTVEDDEGEDEEDKTAVFNTPKPAPEPQGNYPKPEPVPVKPKETSQASLNDHFAAPKQTLNDRLTGEQRPSLADIHQNQRISSIKSHITLNQKFMFINELFDGKSESFENVVNFLDACDSQTKALNYIQNHYGHWDINSESAQEFIEVLNKKYQ